MDSEVNTNQGLRWQQSLSTAILPPSGQSGAEREQRRLSSTLERLSSGKRINQASDDAAGLAVSSTLNATARVHTQAARNVNDGISFLNVADGATSALKDILFRLRELSTQSSNGTLSNPQRQSLDKEAQGLQAEYGRILDTTSFNGIRVFGSGDVVVQAGVGADAALLVKLASNVSTSSQATGRFRPSSPSAPEAGLSQSLWATSTATARVTWWPRTRRQHRERAARQRQRDVSGQAVLRHRKRA